MARGIGVPGERLIMHGDVRSGESLMVALGARVGRIVLDSVDEITALLHPTTVAELANRLV